MDSDQLSIASDFSVIPESMVQLDDIEQSPPIPMCASFFQSTNSITSGASGQCDKVAVTFGPINKVGSEPNISLSVIFWFSDQFKPKSSDRIALYKVGFSSTKDFLCYKWVPLSSTSPADSFEPHRSHTVDFEADMLPNDLDNHYQICYLMKSGHILGVSTTFTLRETETLAPTNEVEEAARNVLSVRIRELVKENTELKEEITAEKVTIESLKAQFSNLKEEHEDCASDKVDLKRLILNLKETARESDVEIKKLQMELYSKEDELKQEVLMTHEVQERLIETVLNLNEIKERLSETVEEKSISDERHQVLMEDNHDLKMSLSLLKDELETSMKEKAASEKIASNLSQELQATRDEFNELTTINAKLMKKIKKLRRVIALMEATHSDDFICVEEDCEEKKDDEEEKMDDGMISVSMSASHASGVLSQCPSSTCSQKLNETVVSVKKTMDEIKHQLNEQTVEMRSLKLEISRKVEVQAEAQAEAQVEAQVEVQAGAGTGTKPKELPVQEEIKKSIESGKEEDKVLYEHCFLPAPCTAPVFLPSRSESPKRVVQNPKPTPRSTAPSAPSPTPSMMEERSRELPVPLCPVETETARNAAVLRHFTENNSGNDVQRDCVVEQPRQHTPPRVDPSTIRPTHQPESDDEDYHSTGDAEVQTLTRPTLNSLPSSLKCPMCPLEFLPSGIHLLNEHINNHLDRTCPMCSLAFQRSTPQKKFEKHVQSHFENENPGSTEDSSGPWDPRDPESRSFQLLEID